MTTVVIIVSVAATAVVIVWFFFARKFPERAAGHDEQGPGAGIHRSISRRVAARPAGPDAESMDASRPGGATPPPPPPQGGRPSIDPGQGE
jgi:hypothetical protein